MKIFAVIFSAMVVFSLTTFNNVHAADLQELRGKIILPDRIRHRNDSHKLTRPSPPRITVPNKVRDEHPSAKFIQRQPKKPPRLKHPKFPIASSDHRGSDTHRRFGPPRFRR